MNTSIAAKAAMESLNMAELAYDKSPLNPFHVAYAVGMEAAERARYASVKKDLARRANTLTEPTPRLLGCWVNGKLRFQSRDHDAIYDYAERHMNGSRNFGNNVWVAPVGSFVDTEMVGDLGSRAMRKVARVSLAYADTGSLHLLTEDKKVGG